MDDSAPIKTALDPIVTPASTLLILGSMPSELSLARQQYYGNPRNHFWAILAQVYDREIGATYGQRLAFIVEQRLALWDVLRQCQRRGSSDAMIRNGVANDFAPFFAAYPAIRAVALNGGKARELFQRLVWPRLPDAMQQRLRVVALPSTSPIPGRHNRTVADKAQIWSALRQIT